MRVRAIATVSSMRRRIWSGGSARSAQAPRSDDGLHLQRNDVIELHRPVLAELLLEQLDRVIELLAALELARASTQHDPVEAVPVLRVVVEGDGGTGARAQVRRGPAATVGREIQRARPRV